MWLVTVTAKPTSRFDLLLDTVHAYAREGNEARFQVADWNPQRETIAVIVHRYADLFYLLNDLTINEPSDGAYNRVKEARVSHVTNDLRCDCTICSEGTVGLEFFLPSPVHTT